MTRNCEPRLLDTDLAQQLGYARPRVIRDLIARYEDALSDLGTLCRTVRQTGGRPATEVYLNKKQSLFIIAKSETDTAIEMTIKVIEKFDAYERGASIWDCSSFILKSSFYQRLINKGFIFSGIIIIIRLPAGIMRHG